MYPQTFWLHALAMTTQEDLPHRAELASVGLWCPLSLPLECVACGGGWVVLRHDLKLSTECAGSGASWEVQAKVIHHLCSACGHPALSYNTIYRWLLPVLGLEMPRQGQCWLLLVPGLAPLGDRYRAC